MTVVLYSAQTPACTLCSAAMRVLHRTPLPRSDHKHTVPCHRATMLSTKKQFSEVLMPPPAHSGPVLCWVLQLAVTRAMIHTE
jgi:hypothetical protein